MENSYNEQNGSAKTNSEYIEPEYDPTDPKFKLLGLMHDLSEQHYCAGWANMMEVDLWEAAQCKDPFGYKWTAGTRIPLKTCKELEDLAYTCEGWWIHGSTSRDYYIKTEASRVFIPLEKWDNLFKELKKLPKDPNGASFIYYSKPI